MISSSNKRLTYLVTGGCGFIGSHLGDQLVDAGHKVIVLDNLTTGSKDNLPDGAELVAGSVTDAKLVNEIMRQADGCFHLAAIASLPLCQQDWPGAHQVNLTGTINIFNAARNGKNNKSIPVIYASSCAVYGDNTDLPLMESATPNPMNPYAADKLGCELHGRVAAQIYGVPTVGLRLFNVYGERQNAQNAYSGVISLFLDRLSKRMPLEIHGSGEQSRDFIYVRDVIHFFMQSMMAAEKKPGAIYNVCTGHATSILTLARLLARMNDTPLEMITTQARTGDIKHSLGNPAKIWNELGLKANHSLNQGLELMNGLCVL